MNSDSVTPSQSPPQPSVADLNREIIQLRAQATDAQRELEALIYAVSHDLRAPLRSLSGFSQALAEKNASQLDATGLHYLSRVQQSAQKLADLIDALLGLSRIARADMHIRSVNLSELAGEAAKVIAVKYPHCNVQLTIEPHLQVMGDSRLLRTALELLLDNAYKFSAQHTQPQVSIGREMRNGDDCFFIKDNGVGFDMAYGDKLFKPFQRLHSDAQYAGVGVGLAAVQRIVARHGGKVWAEAQPECGATFYFSLSPA